MKRGIIAALAYIGTVFAANWALTHLGTPQPFGPNQLPVWPGITGPAGVYFAGLAFALRDITQESLGRVATLLAVGTGALLSYALGDGRIALASGVAFLISELADFAVYTPLRERGWLRAVAISNVVGLVADSALFLWLAFGSLAFLSGQIIGKAWMTAAAVVLLWAVRRAHRTVALRKAALATP